MRERLPVAVTPFVTELAAVQRRKAALWPLLRAIEVVAFLSVGGIAHADALRAGAGLGQGVYLYAAGIQLDRRKPVHESDDWSLTTHLELGISDFESSSRAAGGTRALAAVGKLRWQTRATAWQPFVEVGFGLGGFTELTIAGVRHLGGDFEFTEVLRTGLRFGPRRQFEFGVSGQHFSNAGLHPINEGITYFGVSAAWYYR